MRHICLYIGVKIFIAGWGAGVRVTFPNQGKVFLSFNSQTFSNRTFLSKRFSGNNSFCKVKSPVILKRVWFGPFKSFSLLSDMI